MPMVGLGLGLLGDDAHKRYDDHKWYLCCYVLWCVDKTISTKNFGFLIEAGTCIWPTTGIVTSEEELGEV